jgi:hypothetical protein
MGITPLAVSMSKSQFNAAQKREVFYIYGTVMYLDISDSGRDWTPTNTADPNKEGFMTAGNTPYAYTQST